MKFTLSNRCLVLIALIMTVVSCTADNRPPDLKGGQTRLFTPVSKDAPIFKVMNKDESFPKASDIDQSDSLREAWKRIERSNNRNVPEIGDDLVRLPAMREAAISFGAQSGLAKATRVINSQLEGNSQYLTQIYNFQYLMITGPDGVLVKPPVISEARETWESFEDGKTLRVADTVYEIIEQAQFTSTAPVWQNYLVAKFNEPEIPAMALRPKTSEETRIWRKWIKEGWKHGWDQARQIFETNLNRMNRDYNGMVRYKLLVEEGRISPTVIAGGNLGNTGGGDKLRINDRAIRITRDPSLLTGE